MPGVTGAQKFWKFLGESVRFIGGFEIEGRAFAGLWETRPPGESEWKPWMRVRLKKLA